MKIIADERQQGIPVSTDEKEVVLDSSYFQKIGNEIKRPLIILLHGWNNSKKELKYVIPSLLNKNFNVLIYSQRGHGKSKGKRDLFKINKDIHEVINYSMKYLPNIDEDNINLIGISYGSGVSLTEGYVNQHVKHIFALNPFYNVQETAKTNRHFLTRIYLWLTKLKITEENNKVISPAFFLKARPENKSRIFLLMTRKDSFIPFSQKEKLIKHLNLPSSNVRILEKGNHMFRGVKQEVINQLITWLNEIYP